MVMRHSHDPAPAYARPNEFLGHMGFARSAASIRPSYTITLEGVDHTVRYDPGESTTPLFGGNSNWRGPIWFP